MIRSIRAANWPVQNHPTYQVSRPWSNVSRCVLLASLENCEILEYLPYTTTWTSNKNLVTRSGNPWRKDGGSAKHHQVHQAKKDKTNRFPEATDGLRAPCPWDFHQLPESRKRWTMIAKCCLLLEMHAWLRLSSRPHLVDEEGEHTPRLACSNRNEQRKSCDEDRPILSWKSEGSSFGWTLRPVRPNTLRISDCGRCFHRKTTHHVDIQISRWHCAWWINCDEYCT